jgi:predicted DNA-binding ribbon-helix-helix protein
MKSVIVKHSLAIARHKTSITLEDPFWECLRRIANERGQSLSAVSHSPFCPRLLS